MPQEPNKLLRPLAVVGAILLVIGGGFAMYFSSKRTTQQQIANLNPPTQPAPQSPAPIVPAPAPSAQPAPTSAATADKAKPDTSSNLVTPVGELQARVWPVDPALATAQVTGPFLIAKFSPVGAGLSSLSLADHFETIKREKPYEIQREHTAPLFDAQGNPLKTDTGVPLSRVVSPLSALGIEINGKFINLSVDAAGSLWKFTAPATFTAEITDKTGAAALRVTRIYSLPTGSRDLLLTQTIENLTAAPIAIRWYQTGPVDLPLDVATYVGEKRRLRFGYILSPEFDPTQSYVQSRDFVIEHPAVLGTLTPDGHYVLELTQWPNTTSSDRKYALSWIGQTNRYFGIALHPPIKPGAAPSQIVGEKKFQTVDKVDRLVLERTAADGKRNDVIALRLASPEYKLAPGASADLSQSLYAGALIRREIRSDPAGGPLSLDGLVYYSMGGPCAFCTFNFLTSFLLWLLNTLHWLVGDWALSIVLLVVVVRTLLHPLTKWSQVRMQRFGKQMSGMAPKQAKLKEKYGHDPKLLQAETAKLWREEGINPLGMLGCLPMFLQTPIWIALYATLFFAAELRHQPAFYGIFQKLGHTTFLADLSVPDGLWNFASPITIPLVSNLFGPITGINLLPLVLGVVFFLHQKYLTPPTTVQQTPEQEMQMKMMKWMSVIMFPVLMYNSPAGLTIYFVANSALGILEHKRIRAHIAKHDLLNLDKMKAGRAQQKQGGFFSRMQQLVEQQRKNAEAAARGRGKQR